MIKNNRIDALVEKTKGINTLLDIGCDHGYVILEAFKKDYIKKAIASDINIKPLKSAENNLKEYPVEFILGDGFKKVTSSFDGVVIAGMGSNLITNILLDAPSDNNIKYILQGNNKYENLRLFLNENNYQIIDEELIYDKHYYIIITAIRGKQTLSTEDIYLGPLLKNKLSSLDYYKHRYNHLKSISNENKGQNDRIENNILLLSKAIENLEK